MSFVANFTTFLAVKEFYFEDWLSFGQAAALHIFWDIVYNTN